MHVNDMVQNTVMKNIAFVFLLIPFLSFGQNYWNNVTSQSTVASGDVIGKLDSTKVIKIQNVPVLPTLPLIGQVLSYNGSAWLPAAGGGGVSTVSAGAGISVANFGSDYQVANTAPNIPVSIGGANGIYPNFVLPDNSDTNEIQVLTIAGNVLSISDGNQVTLPSSTFPLFIATNGLELVGADLGIINYAGATNGQVPTKQSGGVTWVTPVTSVNGNTGAVTVTGESTTVTNTATISNSGTLPNLQLDVVDGSITPAKLSQAYLTSEVDGNVTNELQALSISGGAITLSNGGGTVTVPDASPTNENQTVSAGAGISVVQTGQDFAVTNTAPDQTVTISGATGSYPNFTLPDNSPTNELQTLSLVGQNLSLSNGGGTVAIPVSNLTVGPIGVGNVNGASISGGVLTMHEAGASTGGIITTGGQTISGAKVFLQPISITASSFPSVPIFNISNQSASSSLYFTNSNPESLIAAPVGSFCFDASTQGRIFSKQNGSSTVGWKEISRPKALVFATSVNLNNNTTTKTSITPLQMSVVAGKSYEFDAYVFYGTVATSNGLQFSYSTGGGFAGTVWIGVESQGNNTGQLYGGYINSTAGNILIPSTAATSGNVAHFHGAIECTASGTIVPTFASEAGGQNVTIEPFSKLYLKEIN